MNLARDVEMEKKNESAQCFGGGLGMSVRFEVGMGLEEKEEEDDDENVMATAAKSFEVISEGTSID